VRPSSSTHEAGSGGLFDGVLARGPVRAAVSDEAWLVALLEVEAALARVEARLGLIQATEAAAIGEACRPERFDPGLLGEVAAESGNPVVPLVAALREAVGAGAAGAVHRGATSQDILDTAAMLVARDALDLIVVDLRAAADAAARLAAAERDTVMVARTLLQDALPTTFGLVAAGWLAGLDAAVDRLAVVRHERLAVQLGGAVGTLASLGLQGLAVRAGLAADLGLAEPSLAWHTERSRIADLAGALGSAAGAAGKVALDLTLLSQTEVGEVHEGVPGRGGSSTLPQKRNPIASISVLAGARRAPGLVATLLAAMAQEHQRAAGGWHAEWRPLVELLEATGSAAAWLRDALEHLVVDRARMEANLAASGGQLLAERVVGALAATLGWPAARALVGGVAAGAAGSGRRFAQELADRPEVKGTLPPEQLAALLDPRGYLGSAGEQIDRALADHAGRLPAMG
jgi:3-carboxy-cis,cis-muconate cycloisomerase